jgi:uncharacterized membrane protein YfcA
MEITSVLYLIGLSFPTGILIGLTGIGGAALMTPLLILVIGTSPSLAVGTDLVYATIAKALGAAVHWKLGHVDLRVVRKLLSASLPAGILGAFTMIYLHRVSDAHLRTAIGVVLIFVVAVLVFQKNAPETKPLSTGRRLDWMTLACGGFVGFLVGLTSIGSGSLILPFLLLFHRLSTVRAVGTDIFHAAILAAFAAAAHVAVGGVQWNLVPWLLAGSLPGVAIGSRLAPRLPQPALRAVLILVLFVAAFKLIA